MGFYFGNKKVQKRGAIWHGVLSLILQVFGAASIVAGIIFLYKIQSGLDGTSTSNQGQQTLMMVLIGWVVYILPAALYFFGAGLFFNGWKHTKMQFSIVKNAFSVTVLVINIFLTVAFAASLVLVVMAFI